MGNYFKSLRRKIGVVTLLMACVFMAGWATTHRKLHHICVPSGLHTLEWLHSWNGWIKWYHVYDDPNSDTALFSKCYCNWNRPPILGNHYYRAHGVLWIDRVIFEEGQGRGEGAIVVIVYYWSIVLPLTLLSAYLLLSKLKQQKPSKEPPG